MASKRSKVSPFYAYCVLRLEADQEWPVFPGIDGRPVFPIRESRLAMLVSRLETGFKMNAQSIIEHGRVVHRVFERHTVLPFRFGTTFDTENHVRQVLVANRAAFLESIQQLRGKAEMHVKVLLNAVVPLLGLGSTHALRPDAMGGQEQLVCWASQRLQGTFRPLSEQVAVRSLQNGDWLVDFAHLIDEGSVAAYQKAFARAADQMKECQVLVSGPWPPYHFLPTAIRMPAASEVQLNPGRRPARRGSAAAVPVPQLQSRAAKA